MGTKQEVSYGNDGFGGRIKTDVAGSRDRADGRSGENRESVGHKMVMGERSCLQMTGVSDVVSFDAGEIILKTVCGLLMIRGRELHMSRLSLEKGEVHVDGTIDSLSYSDTGRNGAKQERLMSRLFK